MEGRAERRARGSWTQAGPESPGGSADGIDPAAAFIRARCRVLAAVYLAAPPNIALTAWLSPPSFPVADHPRVMLALGASLTVLGLWFLRARAAVGDLRFVARVAIWVAHFAVFVAVVQPRGSLVAGEWGGLAAVLLLAVFVRRRALAVAAIVVVLAVMGWLVEGRLAGTGSATVVAAIELWVGAAVAAVVRVLREVATSALDKAIRGEITDPLTGLVNRRGLERSAGHVWTRRADERGPVALLVADIDHFKQINDTLGHAAGDEVIRQVAAVLSSSIRADDVAVRLGGEEFLILLADPQDQAERVAERLRARVAEAVGPVTVSIGVAETVPDPADEHPAALWRAIDVADRALYQAKRDGRNRVVALPE